MPSLRLPGSKAFNQQSMGENVCCQAPSNEVVKSGVRLPLFGSRERVVMSSLDFVHRAGKAVEDRIMGVSSIARERIGVGRCEIAGLNRRMSASDRGDGPPDERQAQYKGQQDRDSDQCLPYSQAFRTWSRIHYCACPKGNSAQPLPSRSRLAAAPRTGISFLAPNKPASYTHRRSLAHYLFSGPSPAARDRVLSTPSRVSKLLIATFQSGFVRHDSLPGGLHSISPLLHPLLSSRKRQPGYPQEHTAKQPSRQVALRQEHPIIMGMFDQPPPSSPAVAAFLSW